MVLAYWWVGPFPEQAGWGTWGRCQLYREIGAVSPGNSPLGLWCFRTGPDQLVGRYTPGTNRLEEGFQTNACQHQCPCGWMSSSKWLPPVSMSNIYEKSKFYSKKTNNSIFKWSKTRIEVIKVTNGVYEKCLTSQIITEMQIRTTTRGITHVRMALSKRQKIVSVLKDMGKGNLCTVLLGMSTCTPIMANSMSSSQNEKQNTVWSCNASAYICKEMLMGAKFLFIPTPNVLNPLNFIL